MLKISPRVSMNHPVANAVIPSFDLKTFHFFFGNLLIADMRKKHRAEELDLCGYLEIKNIHEIF